MHLEDLEKKLSVKFCRRELLLQALTHKSYINEHPAWLLGHNERLEFLGDAVLELIVSDYLYQKFPAVDEHTLTRSRAGVVRSTALITTAKTLSLDRYILSSRGERGGAGWDRVCGNALEAIIGAIYADQGLAAAQKFVIRALLPDARAIRHPTAEHDPKGLLQEAAQEILKITPTYQTLGSSGPDHEKMFLVGAYFREQLIAEGTGKTKKQAEHSAALAALTKMKWDRSHITTKRKGHSRE